MSTTPIADVAEETCLFGAQEGSTPPATAGRESGTETRIVMPITGSNADSEDFDLAPPPEAVTKALGPSAKIDDATTVLSSHAQIRPTSSEGKERFSSSVTRRGYDGSRTAEIDLKQPVMTPVGRPYLSSVISALDNGQYGPHCVLRTHQKGGMGRILIAYDQYLKRDVALKELHPEVLDDPSVVQRFVGEAEITAQLEHPGIVPVHTLGLNEGHPYYTMKLIKGQTLQDAIKAYHRNPAKSELTGLVRRLASVCKTMSYAHSKGVIHRDLKPANIMLGEHGETLVMDWGLAKSLLHPEEETVLLSEVANEERQEVVRPELTTVGSVVGTLAFMSPEQATPGEGTVGPLSDVFSLGAMLYYLLTGQTAFSGRSTQEILNKVRNSTPVKPSLIKPYVPSDLEAICLKAMKRIPADRYQSADELFDDLCRWLDNEPVQAGKETLVQRTWRRIRKRRQVHLSVPAVLLLGVLTLGMVIVVDRIDRLQNQTEAEDAIVNPATDLLDQPSVNVEGIGGVTFYRETKQTEKDFSSLLINVPRGKTAALTVTVPPRQTLSLTAYQSLVFSILEREFAGEFPIETFFVRLGRGSAFFEFRPSDDWWAKRKKGSRSTISIPLDGSSRWTRTSIGDPSMENVQWIELRFESEKPTDIWVDTLFFSKHR